MEGRVKSHEAQPIGTVVRLDPAGEFGFLRSSDGREIYFHRNSFLDGDFSDLTVGSRVSFADEIDEKGAQATTVKLLGKHGVAGLTRSDAHCVSCSGGDQFAAGFQAVIPR
jgi:cold shock CspA family protein